MQCTWQAVLGAIQAWCCKHYGRHACDANRACGALAPLPCSRSELLDLLAFDPSQSALGKENKVITDEELMLVLDRSKASSLSGKGFMRAEKHMSSFDLAARNGGKVESY